MFEVTELSNKLLVNLKKVSRENLGESYGNGEGSVGSWRAVMRLRLRPKSLIG